jgi:hypothetical protein
MTYSLDPSVEHVWLNGRVWSKTYIPDQGWRWTQWKGQTVSEAELFRKGEVYPMTVADEPVNLSVVELDNSEASV